jgi:hypothetical protein
VTAFCQDRHYTKIKEKEEEFTKRQGEEKTEEFIVNEIAEDID